MVYWMATVRFSNSLEKILISIAKTERNERRYDLQKDEGGWFTWWFPPEEDAPLLEIEEMTLESFANFHPKACEIITAQVREQGSPQRNNDMGLRSSVCVASELTRACELWEKKISNTVRVEFKI